MIKAVVFDMDGLLLDTERISLIAWEQAAKGYKEMDIDEDNKHCLGVNSQGVHEYFKNKYGENFDIDLFLKKCSHLYESYIEQNGVPVKKGAEELLKYLKQKKYKIALATSTSKKSALRKLTKAQISEYFDVMICGDMVKSGKPSPEIYLTACNTLDVKPYEAIGAEDSYNGVKASKRAGLFTVMIPDLLPPDDEMKSTADLILKDLTQLKEYIKNEE